MPMPEPRPGLRPWNLGVKKEAPAPAPNPKSTSTSSPPRPLAHTPAPPHTTLPKEWLVQESTCVQQGLLGLLRDADADVRLAALEFAGLLVWPAHLLYGPRLSYMGTSTQERAQQQKRQEMGSWRECAGNVYRGPALGKVVVSVDEWKTGLKTQGGGGRFGWNGPSDLDEHCCHRPS